MIAVTGAGGFVGRALLQRLSVRGWPAVPVYRGRRPEFDPDVWRMDLADPGHLQQLEKRAPRLAAVVHLAGCIDITLAAGRDGCGPVPGRQDIPRLYTDNVMTTVNLLDYCLAAGVDQLVFASSQAVYGLPSGELLDEASPCRPLEHYALSKLCAERILQTGARQGLRVTVLRFPGVFSENRRSGVVYRFCRQAVEEGIVRVAAEVPLPLDVIHLEDLLDAFEKALHYRADGYQCFNIATGEACSLDILAGEIALLAGACRVVSSAVAQPVLRLDPGRAASLLSWRAAPRASRLQSVLEAVRHAG